MTLKEQHKYGYNYTHQSCIKSPY